MPLKGSKIFSSYRGLGLVSNQIPLVVRHVKHLRGNESYIVTVIGNAVHVYKAKNLRLVSVGSPHQNPITCMCADSSYIYTAVGKTIYASKYAPKPVYKYSSHSHEVSLIIPFGPHLISVDKSNTLYVWDIKAEEIYFQMEFPDSFQISCLMHPATYMNKLLIGSKQGKLQLWNIKTNKLIYSFKGWNSEVKVLEQAPALDVVAVGLSSGEIYVHNLKFDETIVVFKQEWGPVTSISFRTDGVPIMVSGSMLGHIALWDLKDRCLSSQMWEAHKKEVTGLVCFPNEPIMVTSSPDNSLRLWIFDMSDGSARLLKFRDGHSAPPLIAKFHGSLGQIILSAGEDSTLRSFSTISDTWNFSLGHALYNKKAFKNNKSLLDVLLMPPIVGFTSETTQDNPWDNIVCLHRHSNVATTWSYNNRKMGDYQIKHKRFSTPKFKNAAATAVTLSVCGNFFIIGYDSGHMDKYNIQSGSHRGTFKDSVLAHKVSISGIVSDNLNQIVVSSDYEGSLKWWHFKSHKMFHVVQFKTGISALHLHRDTGLLAIVLEDWSFQIGDIDSKSIFRKLKGHTNQITDVDFFPNSKWIVSASLDTSIRTWDLPSGTCIDHFCVPVAATSVAISPTSEFLATIHAGHIGIYLWANRTCFQHVSLSPLPKDCVPVIVPLPSVGSDDGHVAQYEDDKSFKEEDEEEEEAMNSEEYKSPEQISKDLITLALLPTSRWLNLLHIDTIRKRNKPKEAVVVPKTAPFFIPTVPGLNFQFGESEKSKETTDQHSKVKKVSEFITLSPFSEKLKEKEYIEAMEMLMGMGPAAIDVQIRDLDPIIVGSEELLLNFLKMIKHSISNNKYYEAAQGYLGLYLKIHSDFILESDEAQEVCQKLLNCQKTSWSTLRNCLNHSLSLISYLKNAAVINY